MHNPRTEREGISSRVGRRAGTKAGEHKAAQGATKGVLRRAQAAHAGTGKALKRADRARAVLTGAARSNFTVRNVGTKREIIVSAVDEANAVAIALDVPYRLAKSAAKLTAEPVS